MRAHFLSVLALLSSAAPGLAHAAGAEIAFDRAPTAVGQPLELRIDDTWSSACTPQLESVEIDGLDIWVVARDESEGKFCGQSLTHYSLKTRQLGSLQPAIAKAGVQRIHYAVRSSAGLRLRGFVLAAVATDAPLVAIESGYWWPDPTLSNAYAGRGIGLNIERQGATMSAVIFGYREDGEPDWSLGSGPTGGPFTRLGLNRLSQGSGPWHAYREPRALQQLGALWIEPTTTSRARLWIAFLDPTTEDLGLREIEMVRFGFAASPASSWTEGQWLLAEAANAAGRGDAHRLRFRPTGDKDELVLVDARAGALLSCNLGAFEAERVPDRCSLSMSTDDSVREYSFDRVGLRRMRGTDSEGRPVELILLDAN